MSATICSGPAFIAAPTLIKKFSMSLRLFSRNSPSIPASTIGCLQILKAGLIDATASAICSAVALMPMSSLVMAFPITLFEGVTRLAGNCRRRNTFDLI